MDVLVYYCNEPQSMITPKLTQSNLIKTAAKQKYDSREKKNNRVHQLNYDSELGRVLALNWWIISFSTNFPAITIIPFDGHNYRNHLEFQSFEPVIWLTVWISHVDDSKWNRRQMPTKIDHKRISTLRSKNQTPFYWH